MLKPDAINQMNKNITKKLNYAAPKLVCYGRVALLTMAGGSKTGEGTCSNSNTSAKKCGSDPRAKEKVVCIGTHPYGIGLYLFDYKPEFQSEWGHGRQFGVMADEVETVMPEAVCVHANGYKMVDYAMLGIAHSIH